MQTGLITVTEIMSDHSIYLRVSGVYVHERCRLGAQPHPLTYVGRRKFQDGPLRQIWYLIYVTHPLRWQIWMLVWLTRYCLLMARNCWLSEVKKSVDHVQHCVPYSSLTCLCYLSYAWCTTPCRASCPTWCVASFRTWRVASFRTWRIA